MPGPKYDPTVTDYCLTDALAIGVAGPVIRPMYQESVCSASRAVILDSTVPQLWTAIAKARLARGDKAGAAVARTAAAGHRDAATISRRKP